MRLSNSRSRGFTLVELMVAVAVLFIIAAIAIPNYREYIRTAQQEVMFGKIEQFRVFQENFHIDNATYVAGTYAPGGTNDFLATLGYRLPGDNDGVSFVVSAGACGSIRDCYKVVVRSEDGLEGTYESATTSWVWAP